MSQEELSSVPGHASEQEALRQELSDAFSARRQPADEELAMTRADCVGYEGNEAREWLRGKSWRQVADEGVGIEHRDYLSFLTHEGWLYYFPAFAGLALDLDHPAQLDEGLVFRLWSFPEEISSLLTPSERLAIVHFLEYLAAAYDRRGDLDNTARKALDHYWAYFTDQELYGADQPTMSDESKQPTLDGGSAAAQESGNVLS